MSRLIAVAAVASLVLVAGCYARTPVVRSVLVTGTSVQIDLRSPDTIAVVSGSDSMRVGGVRRLSGTLVRFEGDTVRLTRAVVDGDVPFALMDRALEDARYALRPGDVLRERQPSAGRTTGAFAMVLVVALATVTAVAVGSGDFMR